MKRTAGYSDCSVRKCVDDGNKLLRQQNISEAINKYDQAIKERPYYAVPHYNKRIALSIQNDISSNSTEHQEINTNLLSHRVEDLNLAKQTNPCFVVNIIATVPEHTFSDDSSDEEPDDTFNALYERLVNNNNVPFTTSNKIRQKTSKLKAGQKIIEPKFSNTIQDTVDNSVVVGPLLSKILENGFEVHEQDKLSTIAVSVGLNRMYSLSTRKNNSLILELNSKVNTKEIKCKKFGYYWACAWYTKDGKKANIENVKKFYKQLKRKDPDLAQKFITQEENERAERDVPYQDIREYAKNHHKTKELIKEFRDNNSTALIYLHLVDADVYDFNGVHSAYLRIIQDCYKPPTVMSTGYSYPEYTQNQAYHLLSHMERMYRVITTFYIPLGTYYPEPNMCILIPQNCETVEESFIDRKRGDGRTLESPILLTNIQNNRHNVYAIFSDENSIITKIPLRAKFDKITKRRIYFSYEFDSGLVGPTDNDIKKYAKVAQSHSDNLTWSSSLFVNDSIKYDKDYETDGEYIINKKGELLKGVDKQCKKLITNIRNHNEVETSQRKLANRIIDGEKNVNNIVNAIKDIEQFNEYFNNKYARTPEEQALLDIMNEHGISYDTLSRKSLLMIIKHNVTDFIKGIEDDHKLRDVLEKINELFSEYEAEYSNLTTEHSIDLNEIISWDLEKIKFLGSDEVNSAINSFQDSQDAFDQIIECYDSDPNLICNIVEEIANSKETQIEMSFDELAIEYKQIQKESDEDIDENIVDIIVSKYIENNLDNSDYRVGFTLAKRAGWIDSDCSTPSSILSDDDTDYYTSVLGEVEVMGKYYP